MECQGMSSLCSQVPCFFSPGTKTKRTRPLHLCRAEFTHLVFLCPALDASAWPRADICMQRCISSFHSRGPLRCSWVEVLVPLPSPCPTSDCPGLPLICVHTARKNSKRLQRDTGSVKKGGGALRPWTFAFWSSDLSSIIQFQGCWEVTIIQVTSINFSNVVLV